MTLPNRTGYTPAPVSILKQCQQQQQPQPSQQHSHSQSLPPSSLAPTHSSSTYFDPLTVGAPFGSDTLLPFTQPLQQDYLLEEREAKRQELVNHRHFDSLLYSIQNYYPDRTVFEKVKEGIMQTVEAVDLNIDPFISGLGYDFQKPSEKPEEQYFVAKIIQLKQRYDLEIQKINSVANDYCNQLVCMLREQSTIRPLTEDELQMRLAAMQHKFNFLRAQLRVMVQQAMMLERERLQQSTWRRAADAPRAGSFQSSYSSSAWQRALRPSTKQQPTTVCESEG